MYLKTSSRTTIVILHLVACGGGNEPTPPIPPANPDELTSAEQAQLAELSPLPALPPDPTNEVSSIAAIHLGQRLFFDPALSGPLNVDGEHGKKGERGRVSCHTCHDGPHMDDRRDPAHISLGTSLGIRNTPPLTNSAFYTWSNWGGRFDSQWSLVLGAIEKPDIMNNHRIHVFRLIDSRYRAAYEQEFPEMGREDDPRAIDRVFVNVGKSIAAYLRQLVSRNSAFDRFVAGDRAAISASARRGLKLFLKHCKVCHSGPHFSDGKFHALAVAQHGPDVPAKDFGRYDDVPTLLASPFRTAERVAGLSRTEDQRGAFRTPSLRNVAQTSPYMHAGQFKTLANVVAFYNAGGGEVAGIVKDPEMKPLKLDDRQQADLVEFMKALDDQPLPPALVKAPRSADEVLAALRADGFAGASDAIVKRLWQSHPKMKLREHQVIEVVSAFRALAARDAIRALHAVMPRSTVELARATRERGVSLDEADAIARYLVAMVKALDFERLDVFDENHSHVIGREWNEIDYSGEGMTWQSQRDDWSPKGVKSFKRAAYIHAYFVGAEPLPHWVRVYKPRGKMAAVAAPQR